MFYKKSRFSIIDNDGDIVQVKADIIYNKKDVIFYINKNIYNYYTCEDGTKAYVEVYSKNGVDHIRTKPDASYKNNLDNLSLCY
ncbi:MAG: DUF3892 domain-containing protein [Proteobacteria bacterium]|nr:DUF3892 domain-containing protein [Pseudomonadota bacterium]